MLRFSSIGFPFYILTVLRFKIHLYSSSFYINLHTLQCFFPFPARVISLFFGEKLRSNESENTKFVPIDVIDCNIAGIFNCAVISFMKFHLKALPINFKQIKKPATHTKFLFITTPAEILLCPEY